MGYFGRKFVQVRVLHELNEEGKTVYRQVTAALLPSKEGDAAAAALGQYLHTPGPGNLIPHVLWCDLGKENDNVDVRELCATYKIDIVWTPKGSSESNGVVERANGLINAGIRAFCSEKGIPLSQVHDYLPLILERVNENAQISLFGDDWVLNTAPLGPRWRCLTEIADLLEAEVPDHESQAKYRTGAKVLWRVPKQQTKHLMRVHKHLGGHTYVLEFDDWNENSTGDRYKTAVEHDMTPVPEPMGFRGMVLQPDGNQPEDPGPAMRPTADAAAAPRAHKPAGATAVPSACQPVVGNEYQRANGVTLE